MDSANEETKALKITKIIVQSLLMVSAIIVVLSVIIYKVPPYLKEKAIIACTQEEVKELLLSPASAEFSEMVALYTSYSIYSARGTVDASNVNGTLVREKFRCHIELPDDDVKSCKATCALY